MSKARRIRRQHHSTTDGLADYPFIVDAQTARTLDVESLQELARNLSWAKDCQTCGWDLGTAKPALHVLDALAFAIASLHHSRCQAAAWSHQPAGSNQALLSYAVRNFLVSLQAGQPIDQPLMVVNPSLESVVINRTDDRWTVGTVARYRRIGMRTLSSGFYLDRPVPAMAAELNGDDVTVTLEDTGETWTAHCNDQVQSAIRQHGGITLGITTAAHPHHLDTLEELNTLLRSQQIVLAWITLAGTEPRLRHSAPPDGLTTYLLHWGPDHATIGELLATTDHSLTTEQAQQWATTHLNPTETRPLLPWEPTPDPDAWYTIEPLSFTQYFVRRHTDAWKIIRVLSRTGGSAPPSQTDAQSWAARVVRLRDNRHIVSWIPGPTTTPDATTLHGSAATNPP